jgi:hypothetical protein
MVPVQNVFVGAALNSKCPFHVYVIKGGFRIICRVVCLLTFRREYPSDSGVAGQKYEICSESFTDLPDGFGRRDFV